MGNLTPAGIHDYYRAHAALVARQLAGRRVRGYPPSDGDLQISSEQDLLAYTRSGTGGFLVSPGAGTAEGNAGTEQTDAIDRMVITLTTGDGADIATAATAALALTERLLGDGHRSIAVVDGRGGMMLLIPCSVQPAATARSYLTELLAQYAGQAPELATIDPDLSGGRMLLCGAGTDPDVYSGAPYSLVPGAWPGVVMPVHDDDVAAASAGMQLEIEPGDVDDRLALRGDLMA